MPYKQMRERTVFSEKDDALLELLKSARTDLRHKPGRNEGDGIYL